MHDRDEEPKGYKHFTESCDKNITVTKQEKGLIELQNQDEVR